MEERKNSNVGVTLGRALLELEDRKDEFCERRRCVPESLKEWRQVQGERGRKNWSGTLSD